MIVKLKKKIELSVKDPCGWDFIPFTTDEVEVMGIEITVRGLVPPSIRSQNTKEEWVEAIVTPEDTDHFFPLLRAAMEEASKTQK